jgi:hypothetical protein
MLKNVPFKRRTVAAAALAVTLVASAGAFAWSAEAADSQTTPSGMPMHHDFEQMRMHRMAEELSLNSQQQQLAMTAMQKMHPGKEAMQQMHMAHEQHLLALMDPNFDPRKMAAEEDQMHAAMEAQRKEARSAWFALWDTLSAEQRVKARLMLLKMAEREPGHGMHGDEPGDHDGMHGDHDGMHGGPDGMHGGPNGMPPPAPKG